MEFPDFFNEVPTITLRDPLAQFLGAAENGYIRYSYADAVRLTGHSCGVTACAWLMAQAGLSTLYKNDAPERGGISVYFRDSADHQTIGVTASILQLITGAAAESGFSGIGTERLFSRRGLMQFNANISMMVGLRRNDTNEGVLVASDQQVVPMSSELRELFSLAISGNLDADGQKRFGMLWQDRIRTILLDQAASVVTVQEWPGANA